MLENGEAPPYFSSPLTPFPSKTFVFIESLSAAFLEQVTEEYLFVGEDIE